MGAEFAQSSFGLFLDVFVSIGGTYFSTPPGIIGTFWVDAYFFGHGLVDWLWIFGWAGAGDDRDMGVLVTIL